MYPVKRLSGDTAYHLMDFKISATVTQDQAVIGSTTGTDAGSVTDATTTSLVDFAGSVAGASSFNPAGGGAGTLTYSTTQADTEGLVRVYINPDIIYRLLMSGGATENTALQAVVNSTADTAGLTITTTDSPDTTQDDGICWCLSGGNAGLSRKITTYTANTSFVVTVPFPRTIAVNDTFAVCPHMPITAAALQLTTLLTQANSTVAIGTGGAARTVEVVLNGVSDSFVHVVARDHAFNELS